MIGIFSKNNQIYAIDFELQNKLTKRRVDFLFPKNTVSGLYRINCVYLNETIRPKSWPDRIPFGVGISADRKRIHYLIYKSFFKRTIHDFSHKDFNFLNDVCIDKKGRVFVLDSKAEKIFYFDLKKDLSGLLFRGLLSVPNPKRCEVDVNGQLYILSSDNRFYSYSINTYGIARLNNVVSNAINSNLKGKKVIDLTINKNEEIIFFAD